MARSCRDCGMCCTLLRIDSLDKAAGVKCPHLRGTKCSIYEDRPQACRDYVCGWLQGAPVPKPTKAGFITDGSKSADLTIHMGGRVKAAGTRFLDDCKEKGITVILIHGDERQLVGPEHRVAEILSTALGS